jgi:hypothetical protein
VARDAVHRVSETVSAATDKVAATAASMADSAKQAVQVRVRVLVCVHFAAFHACCSDTTNACIAARQRSCAAGARTIAPYQPHLLHCAARTHASNRAQPPLTTPSTRMQRAQVCVWGGGGLGLTCVVNRLHMHAVCHGLRVHTCDS